MKKEMFALVKSSIIDVLKEEIDVIKLKEYVVSNVSKNQGVDKNEVEMFFDDIVEEHGILTFAFLFNLDDAYDIPKAIGNEVKYFFKDWLENKVTKDYIENIEDEVKDNLDAICPDGIDLLDEKGLMKILF